MARTMAMAAVLGLGTGLGQPVAADEAAPDLVVLVTAAEPQTQLMAMVLTMQAVQQGADAHILLCGPGGDLGLAEAPETATAPQPPRDMSPQGLMRMILEAGATVEVCAIYLPALGAEADVLMDGVGVAEPGAMAERMTAPGTRVWSF